jgi:hypothetical protein
MNYKLLVGGNQRALLNGSVEGRAKYSTIWQ